MKIRGYAIAAIIYFIVVIVLIAILKLIDSSNWIGESFKVGFGYVAKFCLVVSFLFLMFKIIKKE